jgi:hypothetical protein
MFVASPSCACTWYLRVADNFFLTDGSESLQWHSLLLTRYTIAYIEVLLYMQTSIYSHAVPVNAYNV